MDKFTETTQTSYLQNIGNSLKGIIVGLVLLIGSIMLLWWNEGRSADMQNALEEMHGAIVVLPDTQYNLAHEGKAVLLQGKVIPLSELVDPEFGVHSDGLVLQKNVEMYQWREQTSSQSEDKLGGSTETITTYTYAKEWSSSAINSSSFKHMAGHENPHMNYKNETFITNAELGEYALDKNVVGRIHAGDAYLGLQEMPETIGLATNKKSYLYIPFNVEVNQTHPLTLAPKVGDVKVSYRYAPAGTYTFAAKSYKSTLSSYTTTNGKSLLFVRQGKVSAEAIFKSELESNSTLTWILRIVGLVLMYIAFNMLMGILVTLAKVIPMLGSLFGAVTGIVSAALTLVLGSVVIAVAWFSARPILSLALIVVAVIIAFVVLKFSKKETK